ncbi:MAG: hypothetical protein HOV79_17185 [Hamadaea sp.]|nr:hypothetical protein [Hamadaea sp.]
MTRPDVAPDELAAWCAAHLDARPSEVLFTTGHLSYVAGLRLTDGRRVVVKARPATAGLAQCHAIQQSLADRGFPCPAPLCGPQPLGAYTATAEVLVSGGSLLSPGAPGAVDAYAGLLAALVRAIPDVSGVKPFDPPPWVHWGHSFDGIWPPPDDVDEDLNARPDPGWADDLGRRVRARLRSLDLPLRVGHGDWEAQNLRFDGVTPSVVHDWDSAVLLPEAAIAGHAAAVWTAGSDAGEPDLAASAAFLASYQRAAGRVFTTDEIEVAWAAGLWTRLFNVKKWSPHGYTGLTPEAAHARAERAALL